MKERGIIFSALMVRAILEGRKTQTRRIVRDLPGDRGGPVGDHVRWFERGTEDATRWCGHDGLGSLGWVRCPYGVPGDRLWVRETWAGEIEEQAGTGAKRIVYREPGFRVEPGPLYRADYDPMEGGNGTGWMRHPPRGDSEYRYDVKWRPSIFMPRWASRITLEVTDVRVERLQSITEDDARAEGVEPFFTRFPAIGRDQRICSGEYARDAEHRASFAVLWDEINGDRALWVSNPWVWVVGFKVVQP